MLNELLVKRKNQTMKKNPPCGMQHHLGWYACTSTQIYCSKWYHIPKDRNILSYQCESLNLTCISSCLPTILYGLQNWINFTEQREKKTNAKLISDKGK